MKVHYLEIVASDVDAVCAAYEAAHGITFASASKQRWMRHPSRALSLRTLRWRFQERVRSRSTSREMWITACGNYDFWPNQSLQPTAFGGG
jgi:hypothetical protein